MAKKETLSAIQLVKNAAEIFHNARFLPVYLASNGISLLNQYLHQPNTNKGCNPIKGCSLLSLVIISKYS